MARTRTTRRRSAAPRRSSSVKAILIGAGRGQRLMPLTGEAPKCYAEIGGRRILDWCLVALASAGLRDVVFVGGYLIERIQADYPGFRFCHNADWLDNNILASLFHAEAEMAGGFVASYTDILYTPDAAQRLVASPADIALLVDTDWRRRYAPRTQHPESDGEKVRLDGERVVEVNRAIPPREDRRDRRDRGRLRARDAGWAVVAHGRPSDDAAPSRPSRRGGALPRRPRHPGDEGGAALAVPARAAHVGPGALARGVHARPGPDRANGADRGARRRRDGGAARRPARLPTSTRGCARRSPIRTPRRRSRSGS